MHKIEKFTEKQKQQAKLLNSERQKTEVRSRAHIPRRLKTFPLQVLLNQLLPRSVAKTLKVRAQRASRQDTYCQASQGLGRIR